MIERRENTLNQERETAVVTLCQKMIREKSYSGGEQGVVQVLKENMERMGFDHVTVDRYGNMIGCIKGKYPGKKLLFDGHIDTVPVTEEAEWIYPPFAAANFAKDTGKEFAGEIYVAGVVHEECFEGVAAREISKAVQPDYVVIEAIWTLEPTHHAVLGDGILELTDIKSAPYPGASVVPEYCRATYDRRLLVGETKESVLKPIEELLEKMMEEDPQLKVKASYAVGKELCHTGNEITQYNFCTNGSHYAGEAGIKTFGLGPSRENLAHTVNEYIEIEQLSKVTDCYYGVMKALLK